MKTRLTETLGIELPVLLAPMAMVSGGRLAAEVTRAGGLGLIGAGYGDTKWLQREVDLAEGARVGIGFITWSLAQNPGLLDTALARQPAAVLLSFGDLQPFAAPIRAAGVPLIAQVQTLDQAGRALEAGADILVAQGGEAGGHGMAGRSTFTFVPDLADYVAARSSEAPVVAAGGVADGRGVAAALALGADGVLVGTRLWASSEALVSPQAQRRGIAASGDDTLRTSVYDVVRQLDWPAEYDARALRNSFLEAWHGHDAELAAQRQEVIDRYEKAVAAEDFDVAAVLVGEAVGLVHDVRPAAELVSEMVRDARRILNRQD